ncbi:MAG: HAD family hydrolase [Thermoplasmatales archaeon]|nr:HAD family hydrolase [Thermoplasmatales archaeon]
MMKNQNISIDSFQAILFDFDGVLAECMNVKTEAFAQLYEPYGENVVKKVVKHHIENGGISRYVKIKYYHEEYLKQPINEEKVEEIAQKFSDLVVEKVIKSDWVKGAKEFLEKYYKKIDLYVISGTPEEELKKIVKERNMNKYFKAVYGSPITKPEHTRNIITEHGYDPEKVLYIGDSLSDCKNAIEAKIPFLGRLLPGEEQAFPDTVPAIHDFFEIIK